MVLNFKHPNLFVNEYTNLTIPHDNAIDLFDKLRQNNLRREEIIQKLIIIYNLIYDYKVSNLLFYDYFKEFYTFSLDEKDVGRLALKIFGVKGTNFDIKTTIRFENQLVNIAVYQRGNISKDKIYTAVQVTNLAIKRKIIPFKFSGFYHSINETDFKKYDTFDENNNIPILVDPLLIGNNCDTAVTCYPELIQMIRDNCLMKILNDIMVLYSSSTTTIGEMSDLIMNDQKRKQLY